MREQGAPRWTAECLGEATTDQPRPTTPTPSFRVEPNEGPLGRVATSRAAVDRWGEETGRRETREADWEQNTKSRRSGQETKGRIEATSNNSYNSSKSIYLLVLRISFPALIHKSIHCREPPSPSRLHPSPPETKGWGVPSPSLSNSSRPSGPLSEPSIFSRLPITSFGPSPRGSGSHGWSTPSHRLASRACFRFPTLSRGWALGRSSRELCLSGLDSVDRSIRREHPRST